MKKYTVILISLICLTSQVFPVEPTTRISNVRQQAMGGVGIALPNDAISLYHNPATLYNSQTKVQFPRVAIGGNKEVTSQLNDLKKLFESIKSKNLTPLNKLKS